MVTTRSGKVSRRASLLQPSFTNEIATEKSQSKDAVENAPRKKRCLDLQAPDGKDKNNTENSSKRARVLTENRNIGNVACNPNHVNSGVKSSSARKIEISEEEKTMNGAPEGDLFDMVVAADDELCGFESDEMAKHEVNQNYRQSRESTSWITKYEAVLVARRAVLFHAHILSKIEDSTEAEAGVSMAITRPKSIFNAVLSIAIEAVESLRSCTVRSGILCLRSITRNCPVQLETSSTCSVITTTLLNKTGSGPRFLAELAFQAIVGAISTTKPLLLIRALEPFASHRNAEIACNAIILAAESCKKIPTEVLQQCSAVANATLDERKCSAGAGASSSADITVTLTVAPSKEASEGEDAVSLSDTVRLFSTAMTAKRSKAKDAAKRALRYLQQRVQSAETFSNILTAHLTSSSEIGEIERMLQSHQTMPSSVSGFIAANHGGFVIGDSPNVQNLSSSCTPSPFIPAAATGAHSTSASSAAAAARVGIAGEVSTGLSSKHRAAGSVSVNRCMLSSSSSSSSSHQSEVTAIGALGSSATSNRNAMLLSRALSGAKSVSKKNTTATIGATLGGGASKSSTIEIWCDSSAVAPSSASSSSSSSSSSAFREHIQKMKMQKMQRKAAAASATAEQENDIPIVLVSSKNSLASKGQNAVLGGKASTADAASVVAAGGGGSLATPITAATGSSTMSSNFLQI